MRYRFIPIFLCVILLSGGCSQQNEPNSPVADNVSPIISAQPTTEPSPVLPSPPETSVSPSEPSVYVNSQRLSDCFITESNQIQYASFGSIVRAMQHDATVTSTDATTTLSTAKLNVTIYHQQNYLVANDRYLFLPSGVLMKDNDILLPIETIAQVLDCEIQTEDGSVYFTGGSGAITPGSLYYDPNDVFWLSHLIHAESGNQSLYGKIAVGNVVLNRVSSPIFPNTIYDVIFQPGQFYDSYSGAITLEPSAESIIAAKLCLDGATVVPNAYWFNGAGIPCWASENKSLLTVIGAHAFYG